MLAADPDGSGEIEFDEFLDIVKGTGGDGDKISTFFKDMVKGKIGSKDLSFNIIVQDIRRREMMRSLLHERKSNYQLQWCKNNNFTPEDFEHDTFRQFEED